LENTAANLTARVAATARIHASCHHRKKSGSSATVGRTGEELDENIARQLPPKLVARYLPPVRVLDLRIKRLMIALRLVRQHYEMHERVGGVNGCEDPRIDGGRGRKRAACEWDPGVVLSY